MTCVVILKDLNFSGDGQFISSPENLAIVRDGSAKAKLQSKANMQSEYMTWWEKGHTSQQFSQLTTDGNLILSYEQEGYVLDKTNYAFNLDVPVTSMDYAGDFGVQVFYQTKTSYRYAHLTILVKHLLFFLHMLYSHVSDNKSLGVNLLVSSELNFNQ